MQTCIWLVIDTVFSSLTSLLIRATDDLDLVGFQRLLIIKFEVNVGELESPHIVAEAVRIEMALLLSMLLQTTRRGATDFER